MARLGLAEFSACALLICASQVKSIQLARVSAHLTGVLDATATVGVWHANKTEIGGQLALRCPNSIKSG